MTHHCRVGSKALRCQDLAPSSTSRSEEYRKNGYGFVSGWHLAETCRQNATKTCMCCPHTHTHTHTHLATDLSQPSQLQKKGPHEADCASPSVPRPAERKCLLTTERPASSPSTNSWAQDLPPFNQLIFRIFHQIFLLQVLFRRSKLTQAAWCRLRLGPPPPSGLPVLARCLGRLTRSGEREESERRRSEGGGDPKGRSSGELGRTSRRSLKQFSGGPRQGPRAGSTGGSPREGFEGVRLPKLT